MPRVAALAAVCAVVVLAGCSGPSGPAPAPSGGTVDAPVIGVAYPLDLPTHCGVQSARFGSRWWSAVAPTDQPHPGGRDRTAGTMTLVAPDSARFDGPGITAAFRPADGEPAPCV